MPKKNNGKQLPPVKNGKMHFSLDIDAALGKRFALEAIAENRSYPKQLEIILRDRSAK